MTTSKKQAPDTAPVKKQRSQWAEVWHRLRKNKGAMVGLTIVVILIFIALWSSNLGLINLFPIPLLDGGHVVIYLIEIFSGRELNERVKDYVFRFGLFLIVSLMLFATYNDFVRLFHRWFS